MRSFILFCDISLWHHKSQCHGNIIVSTWCKYGFIIILWQVHTIHSYPRYSDKFIQYFPTLCTHINTMGRDNKCRWLKWYHLSFPVLKFSNEYVKYIFLIAYSNIDTCKDFGPENFPSTNDEVHIGWCHQRWVVVPVHHILHLA